MIIGYMNYNKPSRNPCQRIHYGTDKRLIVIVEPTSAEYDEPLYFDTQAELGTFWKLCNTYLLWPKCLEFVRYEPVILEV